MSLVLNTGPRSLELIRLQMHKLVADFDDCIYHKAIFAG